MQNLRSLKKLYKELTIGETFYFNAIAGTVGMIEYIRELIKTGKIAPVKEELEKMIVPTSLEKCCRGEVVAPQMTYIKIA